MSIRVEFKKIGDWKKVQRHIDKLNLNLSSSITWGERKVGERLVKIVKGHLRNQDLSWDPLSTETVWKKKGDARILIWTNAYLDGIKTWQESGKRFIGVKKGTTHPITGEEVSKIAQIHEFKSYNGGPFRALWGPSLEEIGGTAGVRRIILEVIYKKLKNLGYPISIK